MAEGSTTTRNTAREGMTVAQLRVRLAELPAEMVLRWEDADYDWGYIHVRGIAAISDDGYIRKAHLPGHHEEEDELDFDEDDEYDDSDDGE